MPAKSSSMFLCLEYIPANDRLLQAGDNDAVADFQVRAWNYLS
jgi:hypothetical protein